MSFPDYPFKTEAELKNLALGMLTGHLITSDYVLERSPGCMGVVFLPLSFMPEDERQHWRDQGVTMFYAWIQNALGSRGINGLPIFMEVGMLHRDEHKRIYEIVRELTEVLQDVGSEQSTRG